MVNPTPDDVRAYFNGRVDKRAISLQRSVSKLLAKVLKDLDIVNNVELYPGAIPEVALNAARDIERLTMYQSAGVKKLKLIGYLCFWIRKIKPLRFGLTSDHQHVVHINELAALHAACVMTKGIVTDKELGFSEADVTAIHRRISRFLDDDEKVGYIAQSMRTRTFGPHHFVMLLENLVYAS